MPRFACWIATVACVGLLLPGAALAQSPWTGAIAGEPNAFGLQGLLFDRTGNGVAVWQGFDPVRSPRPYSALSLRAAGGAWRRGPDIAGVTTVRPGVFTYAPTNLLLVQALERRGISCRSATAIRGSSSRRDRRSPCRPSRETRRAGSRSA